MPEPETNHFSHISGIDLKMMNIQDLKEDLGIDPNVVIERNKGVFQRKLEIQIREIVT